MTMALAFRDMWIRKCRKNLIFLEMNEWMICLIFVKCKHFFCIKKSIQEKKILTFCNFILINKKYSLNKEKGIQSFPQTKIF